MTACCSIYIYNLVEQLCAFIRKSDRFLMKVRCFSPDQVTVHGGPGSISNGVSRNY
jgi:hypothetical protein